MHAPLSLSQCELWTIRYLGQLVEKLANGQRLGYVAPGRGHDVLNQISRLADRCEHVAQYALEGLDEGRRAEYLEGDLMAIAQTLQGFTRELGHIGAAPTTDDVDRLREALQQAFSGRSPASI